MIVLSIVVLVVGFVLLAIGADFFVDGAAAIAQKLSVPNFLIGLTVVALGTSLPECAVTITASVRGNNGMAISNVLGSNIFNLLVVCGACALIAPLAIRKQTLRREFPVSVLAAAILLVFSAVGWKVGHVEGVILLGLFALFLIWIIRSATKVVNSGGEVEAVQVREMSNLRCTLSLVLGGCAIVAGGWLAINAAERVALRLGMSEALVGLTICAVGTSLPELFTAVTAARKQQGAMALGNVIGSNIFNILFVAGIATAISSIAITRENLIDLVLVIAASALLMLMVFRRQELRRGGGVVLLVLYGGYLFYAVCREQLFFGMGLPYF